MSDHPETAKAPEIPKAEVWDKLMPAEREMFGHGLDLADHFINAIQGMYDSQPSMGGLRLWLGQARTLSANARAALAKHTAPLDEVG